MPLDPEVAALLERQKSLPPRSSLDVAQTREMLRRANALAGEPPVLPKIEEVALHGGIRTRQYWPAKKTLATIVYFHGGRFFSGDLESHDTICRLLAVATGFRVVAVDYRLAPEHRFPAAVEDACAAVEWATEMGGGPVALIGDSAGANLAAVAAQSVRDPAIRCQVLIYPMIDAVCGSSSYAEYAEGYGPGAVDMKRGWSEYLPKGADPRTPLASPLYAEDTAGLPPALVLTAEYDTLRDEGEAYARKLIESGNAVQMHRYPGAIHGFFTMPGTLGLARKALHHVAEFVKCRLRV